MTTTETFDEAVNRLSIHLRLPTPTASCKVSQADDARGPGRDITLVSPELELTPLFNAQWLGAEYGLVVTSLSVKRSGPNVVANIRAREAQS